VTIEAASIDAVSFLLFDDAHEGFRPLTDLEQKSYDQRIIEEFRANGGVVGGRHAGRPLLVLTTTGARSGKVRETPLVYGRDGDDLFIIASAGGAATHPAWYHNLRANPQVSVEVGTERFQALASPVPEPDRTRLYGLLAARFAFFREYAETTPREIPVIRLTRVE
jgi:deazaflavin-dependent oxidoreductase (nitroreductase family)